MQLINRLNIAHCGLGILLCLILFSPSLAALESDRQATLQVDADNTDGPLGDGITTLWGSVNIRQGTLHIMADKAEVNKLDGRVKSVTLYGKPAFLEQEIEDQGLVRATANTVDYQVASGLVTLTGSADVKHPQYQISGELLTYDLNIQHFKGSSDGNGNGRIHILLDPEVINNDDEKKDGGKKKNPEDGNDPAQTQTPASNTDNS
jgi:lipopolysaccharide export system protein LptA